MLLCTSHSRTISFFFFNDTATTEIYTLSLHDALPISGGWARCSRDRSGGRPDGWTENPRLPDRQSASPPLLASSPSPVASDRATTRGAATRRAATRG